jgi:hypothetical protein
MARMALLCLAIFFFVGVFAGPLQPIRQQPIRQQPIRQQHSSSESLRPIGRCENKDDVFKAGQNYEYKYSGKAETGLGFADSKAVGLAFECDVQLAVPQPCEFRMTVVKCDVFEHDGSEEDPEEKQFRSLEEEVKELQNRDQISRRGFQPSDKSQDLSRAVSQFDIQAQIANGEVARVIHEEHEETWVVNFKKGILDALQVRTDVDSPHNTILVNGVHGLCPTKYSSRGTSESILEDKDLDSCIHASKRDFELSPLTPVYNMSFVSTAMSSRSVCSYKLIRSSHVESMSCKETHRLLPLPWNANISAMTANVTQTLRFVRKSGNPQSMDRSLNNKEISSILYQHENSTDVDRKSGDNEADEILQDLIKQTIDGLDIGSPAVFDDFVDELRDSSDLTELVEKVKRLPEQEKEVGKYLLVQGLIQCNAPACLRALSVLVQADEIPSEVFEPIIMALALTKQQDPLFLAEITNMCEANPSRTCALMIGAMTHKFINDDEDDEIVDDEESAEAVKQAVKFLSELIEDSKCEPAEKLDKTEEDSDATKIIIALKAIGNLGNVAQNERKLGLNPLKTIEEKIANCISDRKIPANVSIAAIEALRKFVPNQIISDRLLSVLADQERPHQIRIAACMASIRKAADKTSIKKIMKAMEDEKSEQMKAFMISHLRSVLNSEDPNYKEVAKLIKEVLQESGKSLPKNKARIPHSIHLEISKFYEIPFLNDDENDFGGQIESSVIFTPKSYMPKSIHLNISGQAWSEYVNVLETGVDFQGIEDLVEKVLGPDGLLSKSKFLRNFKDNILKAARFGEEFAMKYLRVEDVKEYGKKALSIVQSGSFEQIVDRVLNVLRDVDTSELEKILSHSRNADLNNLMESIKRNIPQTQQIAKVVEKLRRIDLRDFSEETLVEFLEAFGISEQKAREILSQASKYGINLNEIIRALKKIDLSNMQEKLRNLRSGEIQEMFENFLQKLKQFVDFLAEKYNLPDVNSLIEMVKNVWKNPSEITKLKDSFLEARRAKQQRREQGNRRTENEEENENENGNENENENENENDEASLNQISFGRIIKNLKRKEDQEEEDDEELDATAFIRIFGHELGFISVSDALEFFDTKNLMKMLNVEKNLRDIMDGFDIRPTVAAKLEGIHHVTTGLGLPLQITVNLTSIATLHVKLQPQGNSFRKSDIEFEPSGALQLAAGMAIDLPSIHKIEAVSNLTMKSEFEVKVHVDVRENAFDITIEKPDEELDLIHIRHELKLVKDDEDISPFDDSKSNEVKKEKCLPEIVERSTGLKFCAELETSTLRGTKLLSHGPHELRVSVEESSQNGLRHVQISGKQEKQARNNRYELNFRAPNDQQRREVRAVLNHERSRNDVDVVVEATEVDTPKLRIFAKNLADGGMEKFGMEIGIDVETSPRKHYNASAAVIGKISGYGGNGYRDERIGQIIEKGEFNYTVKGSVQTPLAWVNVSSTTAKFGLKLMMEHNLTYFIADEVRVPLLRQLRFPNAQERNGVSKFVLRHGIKSKNDQTAYDLRVSMKLLTFPLLNVPEPTFEHVTQLRVHRDYRHVGLHHNTTWINSQHELEFLNASLRLENVNSIIRLSEPASIKLNVSRNDWHLAAKSKLRKEAGEIVVKTELTAFGMISECGSIYECIMKRVKAEAKSVVDAFKFKSSGVENRPHSQHRFRQGRSFEEGPVRPKKAIVTIESKIRQLSGDQSTLSVFNFLAGIKSDRVFEMRSEFNMQTPSGSPKQMQAVTVFGNDVSNRDYVINLLVVHNQTATNIPYSLSHLGRFTVSRTEGLALSTNTFIEKFGETLVGGGATLIIDLAQKKADIDTHLTLPNLNAVGHAGLSQSRRGPVQLNIETMTKSDKLDLLNHDLKAVVKVESGKVYQSVQLSHSKFESDFKTEVDLYFDGSDADFDAGMEMDDDDEPNSSVVAGRSGGLLRTSSLRRDLAERGSSQLLRSQSRGQRSVDRRSQAVDDQTEENQIGRENSSQRSRSQNSDKQAKERSSSRNDEQYVRQSPRRQSADDADENDENQQENRRYRSSGQGLLGIFGFGDDSDESRDQDESQPRRGLRSEKQQRREDNNNSNSLRNKLSNKIWTARRIRNSLAAIQPKVSTVVRIRSLDPEIIPTVNVDAKATLRKLSIEVDVRQVPRALQELISPQKVAIKGQIQDQKAALKIVFGERNEAGIELQVRSQREASGKIYDRGLTSNGETVHAEITVSLPSESAVAIKIKADSEASAKVSRRLRESAKKAFELANRLAKETSEQALKAVRRFFSNEDHPVYGYTKHLFRGTFEDLKNDLVENLQQYRESLKSFARNLYSEDSLFGASFEDLMRKVNQQNKKMKEYLMDLIRDTPAGEWADAIPSSEDISNKVSEVTRRHLGPQIQMIKARQACITMQSCDAMDALRSAQEAAMEIARSIDPEHARNLADAVFRIVRDLLLDFVKSVKEKSRRNEAVRSLVGTVNLDAVEEAVRAAQTPSIDALMDLSRVAFVLAKNLAVERINAVQQDRDGSITITIPHPLKWSNFQEMPRLTEEQRVKAKEYMEKSHRALTSLWESNGSAKVRLPGQEKSIRVNMADIAKLPKKNMPSHTAMIFGERQVMTFDGKVYSIPESADQQCAYLLARGMKQKNFALIKDKNTVILTVPEMVISIDEKNEVRVNNTRIQLPVESSSKKTRIRLIGDTVEVESDIGISLKVTGEEKVAVVEISIALWGETSGLLGSNDNEPTNDFQMPSGQRADNLEEFLNAFELGQKPECRLVKGRQADSRMGQTCVASKKCADLFGSSASPLNQCFHDVDAEEFKKACEVESKLCQRKDSDEAACNVVAAYRKACSAEGVETEAPADCETCEGDHKENSQWNIRGNQRKVDAVVLVSEHRDLASGSPVEKIRSLMEAITSKLRQSGGQNVRVALVGFSGAGVHKDAHSHTIDSEQFGSPDKLAQALRNLQFKGSQKTDVLEAVTYILDSHDFRPEASKILLVFGAEESDLVANDDRLQAVQEKLSEQSVTMTVFSKYANEEIKDRDHGVNYDGAILSSKPNLQQQRASTAEMPKRKLSYLAKSSRGAVFQLENLLNSDRSKQQQLEERASATILDQIKRQDSMCKTCVCQETDLQQLISACRISSCA